MFILLSCFYSALWGQISDRPPEPDSSIVADSSKIDIIHIGTLKEQVTPEGTFRELIKDVHLKQKEMHLWCDIGFIFPNRQVKAHGNVQMLQDDRIRIFSDSLFYDGISREAQLRQNVVLKDSNTTIFTEKLDYDLNTRIATFPEGSIIESDTTTMISKKGTYNANTNIAHFTDSVRITNPNYKLTTDSLAFNTETETALFIGPTKVYNDEKMVYCEDGFYDSKRNYAELYKNARFENHEDGKNEVATGDTIIYNGEDDIYYLIGNAHYENDDQIVDADTILMDGKTEQYSFRGNPKFQSKDSTNTQSIDAEFSDYDLETQTMIFRGEVQMVQESQIITTDSLDYNRETKEGIARGNVVWRDTSANTKITCQEAHYNDSTKYLLAKGNPILTTLIDQDTMWLRADTLFSMPDSTDVNRRNLRAYYNVQIFKSDIQSRCDSLFYNDIDSMFYFYTHPILWVDNVQFTADTIAIKMKDKQINRVFLYNNSFIVNTNEEIYFNQVKGKDVVTKFVEGKINTMDINKNGETVYYALDEEDKYMGVNDVDCQKMLMFFGDNQIKRIRFQGTPKAMLYPMNQVNHQTLRLEGFQWLDSLQIKNKYELLGMTMPLVLDDSINIDSMMLDSLGQFIPQDSTAIDSLNQTTIPSIETSSNSKPKPRPNSPKKQTPIRTTQEQITDD